MKKTLALFVGLFLASNIFAQEKVNQNQNAPNIVFKSMIVDYGTIEKGADGVRPFDFENIGKEPLIIAKVRSSCGCTVASYPKFPIGPGGVDKIEVKYNTSRVGPFRKTVTVYSNAIESTIKLSIKGEVVSKK
ncbi:MAG: DUF1573 domain-containing protein [Ichthyobacteriaceae bacterium]|nr:DUF1573 domain-containing protein [Ichthyobacteriaceae bacterium]